MSNLYNTVAYDCSKLIAKSYSTSFSIAIRLLHSDFRAPINAIYGFVRLADEIVDTFHQYEKEELLIQFEKDTYTAIEKGISLNPVLHAFQDAVNKYNIERELVDTFLTSMKMDLDGKRYDRQAFDAYVLGSAEVVGLICLRVFCEGNDAEYRKLEADAKSLGAAFQKINFLRDMHHDYVKLGRMYFPNLEMEEFNDHSKQLIEQEIKEDFSKGFRGIKQLPKKARLGVYLAYLYYYTLFQKIQKLSSAKVLDHRIRVPNWHKGVLLVRTYMRHSLNLF